MCMYVCMYVCVGVVPILQDLLEPPEMSNVDASFDYLFEAGMISYASDEGQSGVCMYVCTYVCMKILLMFKRFCSNKIAFYIQ
jgi:hypothetical protein